MSKADRERSARDRLAEDRRRAAAAQRRRRLLVVVLGAVAAAAVVVVIVVVAVGNNGGGGPSAEKYTGPIAPAARQRDGSVAMANSGVTAPVLDVFEDFQCPACKAMEARVGGTIKKLAAEGRVKVVYRPFQLFQQDPLMSNSRRAANAAACMPADHWVKYHDKLYAEQPPEGDEGFANADLVKWAGQLGVSAPTFAACVNGAQQMRQVDQATAYAGKAGVTATPFLALNGRQLGNDALGSPSALQKAVAKAGSAVPRSAGRAPERG
ncbi:thioredoxin domain-containing protein [Actinomadura sp. LD22]|uniref:Thioredoxin domain-containing protein n=1 Tax=Actinomadura physcomitrii TaxID=2650748 RepID=A0A6I4ML07_9ACTN|nr:thioredoxin domain-containing protein [Actinomadura physcomitrii]MWA04281.1 thioredoxin domain-containing protein [Actinomadura physcomitrii]